MKVCPMKIFFYVQHLLGIGRLQRAALVAQALREAGFEVTLASGGAPVEGIPVLQLPPAASDASFTNLRDENGKPVDEVDDLDPLGPRIHPPSQLLDLEP